MAAVRHIKLKRKLIDVRLADARERHESSTTAERLIPATSVDPVDPARIDRIDSPLPNEHPVNEAFQELMSSVGEQIRDLEARRVQSLVELQTVAVELAMMATSHMLDRAIAKDEFPIHTLVQQAVRRLESQPRLKIQLHPADLEQLNQYRAEHGDSWGERVEVVGDAKLQRGTCWADGGDFGLVSTLEQRLAELRQCFMGGLDDATVERRGIPTEDQAMRRFPDRRETA